LKDIKDIYWYNVYMKQIILLLSLLVIVIILGTLVKTPPNQDIEVPPYMYDEGLYKLEERPVSNITPKEQIVTPTPKPIITPKADPDPLPPTSKTYCESHAGTWVSEYKECLGVDEAVCKSIGGVFDACASACRHDPKAEMCTMQCVQICTLN